jgi:hypothetical protein
VPQVKIQIKPVGNQVLVNVDGQGFKGKTCDRVVNRLVAAMGGDPANAKTEYKPEYAAESSTQTAGSSE